eukprot:1770124-Amphidinium_carterae.1
MLWEKAEQESSKASLKAEKTLIHPDSAVKTEQILHVDEQKADGKSQEKATDVKQCLEAAGPAIETKTDEGDAGGVCSKKSRSRSPQKSSRRSISCGARDHTTKRDVGGSRNRSTCAQDHTEMKGHMGLRGARISRSRSSRDHMKGQKDSRRSRSRSVKHKRDTFTKTSSIGLRDHNVQKYAGARTAGSEGKRQAWDHNIHIQRDVGARRSRSP